MGNEQSTEALIAEIERLLAKADADFRTVGSGKMPPYPREREWYGLESEWNAAWACLDAAPRLLRELKVAREILEVVANSDEIDTVGSRKVYHAHMAKERYPALYLIDAARKALEGGSRGE